MVGRMYLWYHYQPETISHWLLYAALTAFASIMPAWHLVKLWNHCSSF